MALSIFEDESKKPGDRDLAEVLGETVVLWKKLRDFVLRQYPGAVEVWNYSGKNYGWGFRLKDKKRAIVYLTPCDRHFKVALVFGEKATRQALESDVSEEIKKIIGSARVYAEGRGFRLDVTGPRLIPDIQKLILIKLEN